MIPVMLATSGRRRTSVVTDPTLILDHDFTAMTSLPAEFTFTSVAGGTYTDVSGATQTAAANQPRFDFHPTTHDPRGLRFDSATSDTAVRSITGLGFSTSEGTMLLDYMLDSGSGGLGRACTIENSQSDGTDRLMAIYSGSATNMLGQYRPAGTTIYSSQGTNGVINVVQRAAIAFAAADGAVYQNGATATPVTGTGASVTVPLSVHTMRLGNILAANRPFIGWIRRVRLYNVRKSDTDLATLTTVT